MPANACDNATGEVAAYDPLHGTWSPLLQPLNKARGELAAVSLGGFIYAIGGDNNGSPVGDVERYDPSLNTWTALNPLTIPRRNFAAVVANGIIYVIGGYGNPGTGLQMLSSVE